MNIEAIHTGDNPVKVTKPMMNNLNKFNTRHLQIEQLNGQIQSLGEEIKELEAKVVELSSSEDKKMGKELKTTEKDLNNLKKDLEKRTNEKQKLETAEKEILAKLPNVQIGKKEDLTNELSDISVEMPTVNSEEPSFEMPALEPKKEEPMVEMPSEEPTFEMPNVIQEEPVKEEKEPEVKWPEFNYMPEEEEIPRRIPEVESINKEEDNSWKELAEVPVVPIYDEEEKEPAKLNAASINIIDSLINNEEDTEEDEKISEPVQEKTEEVKEVKKEEEEMPVLEEVTLKDYIKFPNYQAWLFTFAQEVYGKESFTKEEILDLENKENFVSERRFNTGRVKQAIALTNENEKLIEKTQQAIVARNASQTLAKNLTDELNDTKNSLEELTNKYDEQSTKLENTENTLSLTKKELEDTKNELEKTKKELDEYKTTFNKMRGIMETSTNKKEDKKSKEEK